LRRMLYEPGVRRQLSRFVTICYVISPILAKKYFCFIGIRLRLTLMHGNLLRVICITTRYGKPLGLR
jgi:hypothetical protein